MTDNTTVPPPRPQVLAAAPRERLEDRYGRIGLPALAAALHAACRAPATARRDEGGRAA